MFLLLVISNVSPFAPTESFVPVGGGGGGIHPVLPFFVRGLGLGLGLGFFTLRMPLKKKKEKAKTRERNSSNFQSVNDPPSILYYS